MYRNEGQRFAFLPPPPYAMGAVAWHLGQEEQLGTALLELGCLTLFGLTVKVTADLSEKRVVWCSTRENQSVPQASNPRKLHLCLGSSRHLTRKRDCIFFFSLFFFFASALGDSEANPFFDPLPFCLDITCFIFLLWITDVRKSVGADASWSHCHSNMPPSQILFLCSRFFFFIHLLDVERGFCTFSRGWRGKLEQVIWVLLQSKIFFCLQLFILYSDLCFFILTFSMQTSSQSMGKTFVLVFVLLHIHKVKLFPLGWDAGRLQTVFKFPSALGQFHCENAPLQQLVQNAK